MSYNARYQDIDDYDEYNEYEDDYEEEKSSTTLSSLLFLKNSSIFLKLSLIYKIGFFTKFSLILIIKLILPCS